MERSDLTLNEQWQIARRLARNGARRGKVDGIAVGARHTRTRGDVEDDTRSRRRCESCDDVPSALTFALNRPRRARDPGPRRRRRPRRGAGARRSWSPHDAREAHAGDQSISAETTRSKPHVSPRTMFGSVRFAAFRASRLGNRRYQSRRAEIALKYEKKTIGNVNVLHLSSLIIQNITGDW